MKKKNIWLVALFSIITFGIYLIVWECAFEEEIFKKTNEGTGWKKHLLFLVVTLGLYSIFWGYSIGKRITKIGHDENMNLVFFLLSLFGLAIVRNVWIQYIVNNIKENA